MPKDTMKRLINQEENRAFVEQVDKLGVSHVTAVIYVAQTYVDELKKSGTFTEENQKIAMQKALEVAKKQLTQEALEFIEITYGDITEYLTSKLEAEVKIQKNAPAVLNVIAESWIEHKESPGVTTGAFLFECGYTHVTHKKKKTR